TIMKTRILQTSLAMVFICITVSLYFYDKTSPSFYEGITSLALSEKTPHNKVNLRDRIDLAMQQEFAMTMDPSTGTVPRERLFIAQDTLRMRQARNNSKLRTEASIAGINWTERGPNNAGGRTRAILVDMSDATKKTVWVGSV